MAFLTAASTLHFSPRATCANHWLEGCHFLAAAGAAATGGASPPSLVPPPSVLDRIPSPSCRGSSRLRLRLRLRPRRRRVSIGLLQIRINGFRRFRVQGLGIWVSGFGFHWGLGPGV